MSEVFIAIPSLTAHIHARLVKALVPELKERQFLIVAGVSPVAYARNSIVKEFLQTECTHLFMVDDDTIPPPGTIDALLARDEDIVSGVTPILRKGSITSNVYLDTEGTPLAIDDKRFSQDETFSVEGVGAACILIKREVIEKIGNPWFAEVWGEDGNHMSEDIFFCNRAKDEGFKVMIDPKIRCMHARSVVI